jgi:hypothetical protein
VILFYLLSIFCVLLVFPITVNAFLFAVIYYYSGKNSIMASIDDDGYYQDGFENYVATTTDPGSWMMIGVCLYSISCVLVFLPISVLVGKRCKKQRKKNIQLSTSNGVTPVISNKDNCGGVRHVSDVVVESSTSKEKNNDESSDHLESIDLESKVVFENVRWIFYSKPAAHE